MSVEEVHKKFEVHIGKQEEINGNLTDAVKSIAKSIDVMSQDIKGIGESQHKQELLLEKLNNMDEKIDDNNKRVHKRIDEIKKDLLEKIETSEHNLEDKLLEPNHGIIPTIEKDLAAEKESRKWIWRTITTAIITALAALLINSGVHK